MSDVTRAEFDAIAAQVAAVTDLVSTDVVPKLNTTISMLTKLATAMTAEFAALRTSTAATFGAFDLRLDNIEGRLNRIDGRLDRIDASLAEILRRLP